MTLPALPERHDLVTPDVAVELEHQVAATIALVTDIATADEWRRRAEALAAYLAGTDSHGPLIGATRRTEARIGQLLGKAKRGRPAKNTGGHPYLRDDERGLSSGLLQERPK